MIIPLDFLGLLGIVRGVTAMCGPPLGGLIFEKFEVKIFIETLVFNDIAISKENELEFQNDMNKNIVSPIIII